VSDLLAGAKVVGVAWVAAAIAYMVTWQPLHYLHRRLRQERWEVLLDSVFKRTISQAEDRHSAVSWVSFVAAAVVIGLLLRVFRDIGWVGAVWATCAGYVVGVLLRQTQIEIERRPLKLSWDHHESPVGIDGIRTVERRARGVFESVITFFLRLSIPVGFMLLLLTQDDPRFAAQGWWPKAWWLYPVDSLAGCAFPAGLLALVVGYHAVYLLYFCLVYREAGRERRRRTERLIFDQTWVWMLLVAGLVTACLMVRGLGERQVGWAIAAALLAAFFAVVPLWPSPYGSADTRWYLHWARWTRFRVSFSGVLRLVAVPTVWWAAWVIWLSAPDVSPAHEALRSALRGFFVALIVPASLLLIYGRTRDSLKLRFEPWPIAVATVSAAIFTAPLAAGFTTAAPAGLLAVVAGMDMSFLLTGAPEGHRRLFVGTSFVVWLLAATAGAALSPLLSGARRAVLWPVCLLGAAAVGLVYGSWLRRRISVWEEK